MLKRSLTPILALVAQSLALAQTPHYLPAYITHATTRVLHVWAPSFVSAVGYAQKWGATANPDARTSAFLTQAGQPQPAPFVSADQPRLVDDVWWASGWIPPRTSTKFRTPTVAQWQAAQAANPAAPYGPAHAGVPVALREMQASVNGDSPQWTTGWRVYPVYVILTRTYVWYYDAPDKNTVTALATADWVTNGAYALGRPITQNEATSTVPYVRTSVDGRLPSKPWQALFSLACEPAGQAGPSYEYCSDAPYGKRAPYGLRYPEAQPFSGATNVVADDGRVMDKWGNPHEVTTPAVTTYAMNADGTALVPTTVPARPIVPAPTTDTIPPLSAPTAPPIPPSLSPDPAPTSSTASAAKLARPIAPALPSSVLPSASLAPPKVPPFVPHARSARVATSRPPHEASVRNAAFAPLARRAPRAAQAIATTWYPIYVTWAQNCAVRVFGKDIHDAESKAKYYMDAYDPKVSPTGQAVPNGRPAWCSKGDLLPQFSVWWASAWAPPLVGPNWHVPSLADFQASVSANPGTGLASLQAVYQNSHGWARGWIGQPPSEPALVCGNALDDTAPTDTQFTVYVVRTTSFVWYLQANSQADADAAGKAMWVAGGMYAPAGALTPAQLAGTASPPADVPNQPFYALSVLACYPYVGGFDMWGQPNSGRPQTFQYVSDAPYGKSPLKDYRSPLSVFPYAGYVGGLQPWVATSADGTAFSAPQSKRAAPKATKPAPKRSPAKKGG